MLQYDSVHGRFQGEVQVDGGNIIVNGRKIRLTQERDPANLKWDEAGVDVVIESTGLFLTKEDAQKHLDARSEEHTSELQSLMRRSYAGFCLKKKKHQKKLQGPNTSTSQVHNRTQ